MRKELLLITILICLFLISNVSAGYQLISCGDPCTRCGCLEANQDIERGFGGVYTGSCESSISQPSIQVKTNCPAVKEIDGKILKLEDDYWSYYRRVNPYYESCGGWYWADTVDNNDNINNVFVGINYINNNYYSITIGVGGYIERESDPSWSTISREPICKNNRQLAGNFHIAGSGICEGYGFDIELGGSGTTGRCDSGQSFCTNQNLSNAHVVEIDNNCYYVEDNYNCNNPVSVDINQAYTNCTNCCQDAKDSDNDGLLDEEDNCPNTPNSPHLGTCLNKQGMWEISNTCENQEDCPENFTCILTQQDSDNDSKGDVCDLCNDFTGYFGYFHMRNIWAGRKYNDEHREMDWLWYKRDSEEMANTEIKTNILEMELKNETCYPKMQADITINSDVWLGSRYMEEVKKSLETEGGLARVTSSIRDVLPNEALVWIRLSLYRPENSDKIIVEIDAKKWRHAESKWIGEDIPAGWDNILNDKQEYDLDTAIDIIKDLLDPSSSENECAGNDRLPETGMIEYQKGDINISEVACKKKGGDDGNYWHPIEQKTYEDYWLAKRIREYPDGVIKIEEWNYQGDRIKPDQMTEKVIDVDYKLLFKMLRCCKSLDEQDIDEAEEKIMHRGNENSLYLVRDATDFKYNGLVYQFSPEFKFSTRNHEYPVIRTFDYSHLNTDAENVFVIRKNDSLLDNCQIEIIENKTFTIDEKGGIFSLTGLDYEIKPNSTSKTNITIQLLNLSNCFCNNNIQDNGELDIDCGGKCQPCPPTCNDGIKNGNETGIDCGGNCQPCYPSHCTNFIQDENETGIDCGGECILAIREPCGYDYNRDCQETSCPNNFTKEAELIFYNWRRGRYGYSLRETMNKINKLF
ncbi:MAG: hypothetical protein ACP5D2_01320 [Candidatus Nanoarchaeia archaeon]